ncbi:hypothetical protein B0H14DRAFT_3900416 [Mycena olivaceomarginata]|nr:hypothetical protein B0H14DRAFT_3900416 [Mycena olivaceomarginata]
MSPGGSRQRSQGATRPLAHRKQFSLLLRDGDHETEQQQRDRDRDDHEPLCDPFVLNPADLRSALQDESSSDGGYEAETEYSRHSRQTSNSSLSPGSLRRQSAAPWDRGRPRSSSVLSSAASSSPATSNIPLPDGPSLAQTRRWLRSNVLGNQGLLSRRLSRTNHIPNCTALSGHSSEQLPNGIPSRCTPTRTSPAPLARRLRARSPVRRRCSRSRCFPGLPPHGSGPRHSSTHWIAMRFGSSGIALFIQPCDSFFLGNKQSGRSNLADWICTVYHDMATHDVMSRTGGLDASIRLLEEQARPENAGNGFTNTLGVLLFQSNHYVSIADVLAAATIIAIENWDPEINFRGGHVDAGEPNLCGVPEPQQDLNSHNAAFSRQGFTQTAMIGLTIKPVLRLILDGNTIQFSGEVRFWDLPEDADRTSRVISSAGGRHTATWYSIVPLDSAFLALDAAAGITALCFALDGRLESADRALLVPTAPTARFRPPRPHLASPDHPRYGGIARDRY